MAPPSTIRRLVERKVERTTVLGASVEEKEGMRQMVRFSSESCGREESVADHIRRRLLSFSTVMFRIAALNALSTGTHPSRAAWGSVRKQKDK
jgi:hypothetical protein